MVDLYALPTLAQSRPRVVLNNSTPFTPALVHERLTQVSDPEQIYANRIKGRQILLDNPARVSKSRQEADEKRKARKKAAQAKKKWVSPVNQAGLWKLKDSEAKYRLFLPLHHLWLGYVSELLALPAPPPPNSSHTIPNSAALHAKLVKADFHGSIITVRKSKNPCLVGLSGIVIFESENAFRVITKEDRLKVLPKQNSIFGFGVPLYSTLVTSEQEGMETVDSGPHLEFELHGNHFRFRSADRASRKFKHKETVEL